MSDWEYVPVRPQVKERPRLGRRRKAFTPDKTKNFEAAVKEWWTENVGNLAGNNPVSLEVQIADRDGFYVRVCELEACQRPVGILGDLDNYVKAIGDGLNAAAFDDDKQIEQLSVMFVGPVRKPFYKSKQVPGE